MLCNLNSWKFLPVVALGILTMSSLSAPGADVPASPGYHLLKEIPIGGDGGWDYLAVDETARRLYVTHETKIVVVNVDTDKVVGEITNTPGVHGFAPVSQYGLGYSSNGKEGKLSMVDLKKLKMRYKIKVGQNPDAIIYDPGSQQIYTFNHGDNSVTVLEGDDGDVITTIALPGKPEFAVADPKAGRVYCNLEDKSTVAVIDTVTHKVVNVWPIAPGEKATGMALDPDHHRLFIGCGGNNMMVMMDSTDGKVVASVPIGAGVDANAFDAGTQLAFSSNGEGNVTIAHEDSPDKLTVVQTLITHRGAAPWHSIPRRTKFTSPWPNTNPQPREPMRPVNAPKWFPAVSKFWFTGCDWLFRQRWHSTKRKS